MTERPLAESLAQQILRDDRDLQWLAPLAREYLRLLEASSERATPVALMAYEKSATGVARSDEEDRR
jgi:hypothetical protein